MLAQQARYLAGRTDEQRDRAREAARVRRKRNGRAWEKRNPDRVRAMKRREQIKNADRYAAYARNLSEAQKQARRERVKRWARENPERRREQRRIDESARRARKRGLFVERVDPAVVYERDEGVCGVCGEPVEEGAFHVDHIVPLAAGGKHGYANVQLAHATCNLRKAAHV